MVSPTKELQSTGKRPGLVRPVRAAVVVLHEEFGVHFTLYDAASGEQVEGPEPETATASTPAWQKTLIGQIAAEEQVRVYPLGDGHYQLMLPLYDSGKPVLVACGLLSAFARTPNEIAQEQMRLQKWLQGVCDRLRGAHQSGGRHRSEGGSDHTAGSAWQPILTLDHLIRRLRIHKETGRNQKRILETALQLLRVQAVIHYCPEGDGSLLSVGELSLSAFELRQLTNQLASSPDAEKQGFVLCNDVQKNDWGARFPRISNLLAFALREHGPTSWVIALNKKSAAAEASSKESGTPVLPIGRGDVVLLTPFASLLGLHLSASRRYRDLKELLVGLTRSLTAAIDAKDSYTFGHSERVARVAIELARELGMEGDELSDIYLAGLLHDIGKIGIRDAVLCKQGPLTPEERKHLEEHVIIGHNILADLHAIRHLLPGVLYHHERYDGTGYPERLKGETIPLLARILAVADTYDAMSTNRPYRAAMPQSRVEEVLTQGAGEQWDRRVVEAFLRCRQKVYAIRQRGLGESLRHALDGALRTAEYHTDGSSVAPRLLD